jgi:hypothetical protein
MASGVSVYSSNYLLNALMRGESQGAVFAGPYWLAAFTSATASTHLRANDYLTALEVSPTGTAYARIQVRGGTGIVWASASGGTTNQNQDLTFSAATAGWGTVYAVALMDAGSGGNVIVYADLQTPRTVVPPDVLRIPATQFVVNI